MDDNDVCPLCCEEFDMSDRNFFPCKCGYQVCMWCWHRIRESESGLCPACRTPYGDDPHEFSAVDMEEVVKANKEKAAADKKERERLRHQQASAIGSSSVSLGYGNSGALGSLVNGGAGIAGMHIGGGSDGDLAVTMGTSGVSAGRGHLEPPKDRNQLANMRVIRRNLVYAVGLPPSIATEETLRKPEYFGQYGKIAKIVINRNHNGNGDPRRASASAYVTFAHKEDTLACILVLDGFYVDGRNIRASFGTSKYCSAFIKNVRCNNPDCTYLHCMGESEDTFTKQEIQAGYVTSGRDDLARQQHSASSAVSNSVDRPRRRVGGGGPSGTGRAPSSPVFPAPTFDEPHKTSSSASGPLSAAGHLPLGRSSSAGAGYSVQISSTVSAASVAASKVPRSSSLASTTTAQAHQPNTVSLNQQNASPGAALGGSKGGLHRALPSQSDTTTQQQDQLRRVHPQSATILSSITNQPNNASIQRKTPSNANSSPVQSNNSVGSSVPQPGVLASSGTSITPATAASVVAGVRPLHSSSSSGPSTVQPPAHTTLTPLTPLKRPSAIPISAKVNGNLPSIKAGPANGANGIGFTSVSNASPSTDADSVQLPPNMPVPKGLTPAEQAALLEQRREAMAAMARQQREMTLKLTALRSGSNSNNSTNAVKSERPDGASYGGTATSSPTSSVSSASGPPVPAIKNSVPSSAGDVSVGVGTIGGTVIGGGLSTGREGLTGSHAIGSALVGGPSLSSSLGDFGAVGSNTPGLISGGGPPAHGGLGAIGSSNSNASLGGGHMVGGLTIGRSNGGEKSEGSSILTRHPAPASPLLGKDKWSDSSNTHGNGSNKLFGSSGGFGIGGGGGIWGNESTNTGPIPSVIGTATMGSSFPSTSRGGSGNRRETGVNKVIGPSPRQKTALDESNSSAGDAIQNSLFISGTGMRNAGSSVLASMLGIDLPTGSGSLRESSTLWSSSPSSIPSASGVSINNSGNQPEPIGSGLRLNGNVIVGGRSTNKTASMRGFAPNDHMTNTGTSHNGDSNSDIALLQSLLPGVHITSGNAYQPAAPLTSGNVANDAGDWGATQTFHTAQRQEQRKASDNAEVRELRFGTPRADTWGNTGLYSRAPNAPSGNGSEQTNIW